MPTIGLHISASPLAIGDQCISLGGSHIVELKNNEHALSLKLMPLYAAF